MLTNFSLDSREPALMVSEFSLILGTKLEVHFLPFGDCWWSNSEQTFGGEFKSVSDLLSSLWTSKRGNRLERQLQGLRNYVDKPFLAIHGILWPSGGGIELCSEPVKVGKVIASKTQRQLKVRMEALDAYLWSIQQQGIAVIWRPTRSQTVKAVATAYRNSGKSSHTSLFTTPAKGTSGDVKRDALMAAKGVGASTAEQLLKAHGGTVGTLVDDLRAGKVNAAKNVLQGLREALL